jgi:hypothetical protein
MYFDYLRNKNKVLKRQTMLTEAGQQYATAYDVHYKTKDIYKAFKLYGRIICTSARGDPRYCEGHAGLAKISFLISIKHL